MNKPKRIAVAGATGYLGSQVARALKQRGHFIRALVRDKQRLGPAKEAFDEVFVGQATERESLVGLADDMDAVFSAIGVRQLSRYPTFWQVDRDANLAHVDEAERAGADRFVYVSVFGAPSHRDRNELFEAKEQVTDRLRGSSLRETIIRPTGLFNDMKELFNMAVDGRVWLFGDGSAEVNPIHGADVGDLVAQVIQSASAATDIDAGGPETFSMRGIGELAFEALDKPPKFAALPLGVLRAAAAVTAPFNRNLGALLGGFHFVNSEGAVAPTAGRRRLQSFFAELAEGHRTEAPHAAPAGRQTR
ncbi:MAG: SDR family oxidoreductase [Myxococcota bacterium]